ncbi:competence protein CoiA [Microbulbifer elongatus]|uniref:competence protein CoiA n=1 Tax=Microbulbifer elongatus TaxID=86173 RepID=UPI001E5146B5|nr:competence protein CoiA family protein [Microbulbifer elongatus]
MKYALVNGAKTVAARGLKGICPCCGSVLIPKCGDQKVHHWSHKGNRNCDQWWENETEWHRRWKGYFPKSWQEVVHFDESNEKHIADVKTGNGWAVEFQHSYLNNEERQSRSRFYKKLVWVVDGSRRKMDRTQFIKVLKESSRLRVSIPIYKAHFPDECRLLKEWYGYSMVFFDFKEVGEGQEPMFWFLFPRTPAGSVYLSPFSRERFIEIFSKDRFDEVLTEIILPIHAEIVNEERKQRLSVSISRNNSVSGVDRYVLRKQSRRRRF